jgi:hypothetical protein
MQPYDAAAACETRHLSAAENILNEICIGSIGCLDKRNVGNTRPGRECIPVSFFLKR